MTSQPRRLPWGAVVVGVLVCLLLDQTLKAWAVQEFPVGTFREVIPGWLSLGLIYNSGAAWSLFSGAALPLAVLRLVAAVAILVYLRRPGVSVLTQGSLTLVSGGALGNALDGLNRGTVVDMLSAQPLNLITRALGQGDFPIFNLADVWVCVGVLLLLLEHGFTRRTRAPHSTA